jgi:hypothetical protein
MKPRITRAAIAVLVISFLFIGCKKSSDSKYYVKFNLNGNWITMKNVLGEIGPDLADPDLFDFGVNGNSDDQKEIFSISLQTGADHFETGKVYASDDYFMPIDYTKDVNSSNTLYYSNSDAADGLGTPYFTITFTMISDKEVKGTFTGNYLKEVFNDEVVTLSGGEFFARRIR